MTLHSAVLSSFHGACKRGGQNSVFAGTQLLDDSGRKRLWHRLDRSLSGAFLWTRFRRSYRLTVSNDSREFHIDSQEWLVLGGTQNGTKRSIAMLAPNLGQIEAAVEGLLKGDQVKAQQGNATLPPLQTIGTKFVDDSEKDYQQFWQPVQKLHESAKTYGNSRTVFRGTYLQSDADQESLLSATSNSHTHRVRTRAGVVFATWTGRDIATAESHAAGMGGPEISVLNTVDIQSAADQASAQTYARGAASGAQSILLSPHCAAYLALYAIAKPQCTPLPVLWLARLGKYSGILKIYDDPTIPDGYGSFEHDWEGRVATPQSLLGNTELWSKGRLRRDTDAVLRCLPSNVVIQTGTSDLEEMIQAMQIGVLLEGPQSVVVDREGTADLLCSHGREVVDGRLTGRVFSHLRLRANLHRFVAATEAIGRTTQRFAFTEDGIGMSAQAPHWLSRGTVGRG